MIILAAGLFMVTACSPFVTPSITCPQKHTRMTQCWLQLEVGGKRAL